MNVKTLYQYHSSNSIPLRGPPSSLSANELAGIREGEPRALLSPIGGNNSSLWNHRSLMEQGKLANVGPEGGELESSADQPCLPEGADVGKLLLIYGRQRPTSDLSLSYTRTYTLSIRRTLISRRPFVCRHPGHRQRECIRTRLSADGTVFCSAYSLVSLPRRCYQL